jgi:hypothetical protein
MASLAVPGESNDEEYQQKTIAALTEFRIKLGLSCDPPHELIPALLEPPTFDVERQMGVCPRSGRTYTRRGSNTTDTTDTNLLPSHIRLFPAQFMDSEAPFTKDIN